jgi:FtsP/CotA-like multicopper oxidase with cupredoxin domain
VGNAWKKVAIQYNVTTNTVLEFDFSSSAEGEIHGIGFDGDNTIDGNIFQLYGTQPYGIQDFNTYGSGTVHYTIPVGTFYTGNFLDLTFANDHDVASPTGESVFSNIVVNEGSAQATPTTTFGAAPSPTYPGPDFSVNATTDSDGALTYSYVSGPCSLVDGNAGTFSPTGVGDCVVQADTAATASFFASSVQQTVTISSGGPGTPSFNLYAVTGTATLPGQSVTTWGYTTDGSTATQPGGPTLVVNQGDEVTINLYNQLGSEDTALLIQGQPMIPDLTGVASGGNKSYVFTASKPGTFLYEAGLLPNAQHQVAMGLYGALVVRPTGASSQAYASASTAFDVEQVLVLSELDPALNNSTDPTTFDMRTYSPKYYLINGKAYPDTDAINVTDGDTVLLRYVNAGLQAHSMSTLGLSQTIIAQDGHANAFGRTVVAETIATGQTLDTLVSIPGADTQYPLYDASLFLRNNTGTNTFAGLGGMLTMIKSGTPVLPADTAGPIANALDATPNPANPTDAVTVSATISDVATGGSTVDAAEFYVDSTAGTPTAMTGTFGSLTVPVSGTIPASTLAAGAHTIYVRGHDSVGNWGAFATVTLTVDTVVIPPTGDSLDFSTAGIGSGPSGVGADAGDIYSWDGSVFDTAIDVSTITNPIPNGANVDGFDRVGADEFYMSFTAEVTLPGIGAVQNEDVVHYVSGTWSVFFDGSTSGLADTLETDANIDAISIDGITLYYSTSNTILPDGVTGVGDDADIYSWSGGTTSTRVHDATALGWSSNNVDGLVFVDADHFYLSYSPTSTPVAGVGIVQDEDVVYYNTGVWSVYFDGTSNALTSPSLDVDAFHLP